MATPDMTRIGILPLARPTFDVDYANSSLAAMLSRIDELGIDVTGPRALLLDAEDTRRTIASLRSTGIDCILVLQVTFTDAALTVEVSEKVDAPILIWAVPEPRTGGRLRLNSFCGLNLASHALGLRQCNFGWLYADPEFADLKGLLEGERSFEPLQGAPPDVDPGLGRELAARLGKCRIGRIGSHPEGFHTCAYDPRALARLSGTAVEDIPLSDLFSEARKSQATDVETLRETVAQQASGLEVLNQNELERSLRLKLALDEIAGSRRLDALAIRCWPEAFTEFGGALCGPASLLGSAGIPCACEADVYGALTQLLLRITTGEPVFLTDLVDVQSEDNTGVVWHCGQAPLEMADTGTAVQATIHSNRRMPLLYEFPLRPGRVTLVRISQARGTPKLVIAGGEMLQRPNSFAGTSGVVRFDRPANTVLRDVMASGLEHHLALAYGEHRPALRSFAAATGLPVIELGEDGTH